MQLLFVTVFWGKLKFFIAIISSKDDAGLDHVIATYKHQVF